MDPRAELFRQKFQTKTKTERKAILDELAAAKDTKIQKLLYNNPEIFLFDKQIISGDQRYTIFCCGRSFGKTHLGSGWIARLVLNGAESIGLIGPTHSDVEQVMVKAIKNWFPPGEATYVGGDKKTITFKNYPATIYCYSADTEIRGPNLEYLWCDEIVKWNDAIPEKIENTFSTADFAVRIGENPQTLITSTPKPFPIFIKWETKANQGNSLYKMYRGTMFDNPFLSDSYKQAITDEYAGQPNLYKQEVLGEIITEVPGAAWSADMIEKCHIFKSDFINLLHRNIPIQDFKAALSGIKTEENQKQRFSMNRIAVTVDPTVSSNPDKDECGIMVVGLGTNGHSYLFSDRSGKMDTYTWAKEALLALKDYRAGCIVIEDNQGGELVERNIRALDPMAPIKRVRAINGKIDRALPVSALYARGLVHHIVPDVEKDAFGKPKPYVNPFEKLEYQMTHFTGNPKEKSPDRLDALVWAIHELMLTQTYVYRDFSALGSY